MRKNVRSAMYTFSLLRSLKLGCTSENHKLNLRFLSVIRILISAYSLLEGTLTR